MTRTTVKETCKDRRVKIVYRIISLQIIQLVEGKASAYVFASPGCKKWDTCAPEAILHAVGGKYSVAADDVWSIKMQKNV